MARPQIHYRVEDIRSRKAQQQALWAFVQQWTGHPQLIDAVSVAVKRMKVPARDEVKLARAVQLIAQHIKYFREFPERWQSPMRTLAWRFGDCDDKSILIASALRSFRVPVRLKFVRFKKTQIVNGKPVSISIAHVYPIAYLNDKWTAIESVRPYPLGKDPESVLRSQGYQVSAETIGDTETKLK